MTSEPLGSRCSAKRWAGLAMKVVGSVTCQLPPTVVTSRQRLFGQWRGKKWNRSGDAGATWSFLSVLADTHDYPQSHEGPNEHDITLLPDGRTLLAVVRLDGGDGGLKPPLEPYYYLPYHRAVSKDWGKTWSALTPIPNAGCARPRLLTVGWTTLLTGGRFRVFGNTC